jgi:polyhydroxyalkanoate synthesis regulator phasin
MLQEYIDELQQKAGLSAEQARKAVETIIAKVKTKVPEALHGAIDSMFAAQGTTREEFQQKYQSYTQQAEEKLRTFGDQARDQLNDLADKAEDMAQDVHKKVNEAMKGLEDNLSDFLGKKTPPES